MASPIPIPIPKVYSEGDSSDTKLDLALFEQRKTHHRRHKPNYSRKKESHSESDSEDNEDSEGREALSKREKKRAGYENNDASTSDEAGDGGTRNSKENPDLAGQNSGYAKNLGLLAAKVAIAAAFPVTWPIALTALATGAALNPKDTKDPNPLKEALNSNDAQRLPEGISPMKSAKAGTDELEAAHGAIGLHGIPPDAKWTKISRRLVNPEALDAGKERYEDRDDFVIVLRVLSRDEVQAYAEITQRIRAAREEAERREKLVNKVVHQPRAEARSQSSQGDIHGHSNPKDSFDSDSDQNEDPIRVSKKDLMKEHLQVELEVRQPQPHPAVTEHVRRKTSSITPLKGRSPGPRSPTSPNEEMRKPHSHEPKKNIYTEGGSDSDEWLFGGWSDKAKELREKDSKDPSEPMPLQLKQKAQGQKEKVKGVQASHAPLPPYISRQDEETKHEKPNAQAKIVESRETLLEQCDQENDDSHSIISQQSNASSLASITDSLFSLVSASSMSSIAGSQDAVDRLVSLLLEDETIKSVCNTALVTIARDRFERNLRRLLKEFAVALRKEAGSIQERRAAHFVHLRARNSAHIICDSLKKETTQRQDGNADEGLSEESGSDQSDDEVDDLQQLEAFIKASKAIEILRENLTAFVHYRELTFADPIEKEDGELTIEHDLDLAVETEQGTSHYEPVAFHLDKENKDNPDLPTGTVRMEIPVTELGRSVHLSEEPHIQHAIAGTMRPHSQRFGGSIIERVMSSISSWPSPVAEGKIRTTWKCKCGHTITDDFIERRSGAVLQLEGQLAHLRDSIITTRVPSLSAMGLTLSRGVQTLLNNLRLGEHTPKPVLPFHEMTESIPDHSNFEPRSPPSEAVYLLICYNEGRFAIKLLQIDLTALHAESDRVLFQILRSKYHKLTRTRFSWLSLKTLESIKFVYFEMYKSELVDVRKQDDVPPPEDLEYRYEPAPPQLIPPVGSNYLMHISQHPECAEDEPICLSRFPKKQKEKLKCLSGVRPGWGLQFIEGWDSKKIWIILFVFFGLGSLAMGVLWAVFEHSIQDAFSMAAYMVAFATVSVGTVQAILVM